jgi:hypothetical protein
MDLAMRNSPRRPSDVTNNAKVELTSATPSLQDSYQAIPALKPPRLWEDIEAAVAEEIAQNAAREGLE